MAALGSVRRSCRHRRAGQPQRLQPRAQRKLEIDFAGGQARRVEAINAQAAASVANAEDAKVQLAAEIARAYVSLREAQGQLELVQRERDLQQQILELTYQRYTRRSRAVPGRRERRAGTAQVADRGSSSDIDVFKDTLAVLTGEKRRRTRRAPGGSGRNSASPRTGRGDDPAALARRPDVRAAERMLAAANARIGVAEAARFPKISFMGILGLGGSEFDDITDPGNLSAIALPRLQWNLLISARQHRSIRPSARDEAEARYVEVVLGALRDAEQSLARFGQQRANVAALAQIVDRPTRLPELNEQRRAAGVISQGELNTSIRKRERTRGKSRSGDRRHDKWLDRDPEVAWVGMGLELSRDNRTSLSQLRSIENQL